jgi:hypothetical protein
VNKHIELVKKWLGDPDSVTEKEMLENLDAAEAAYDAASDAEDCAYAVYSAALGAATNGVFTAKHVERLVKKYEELAEGK